ncbi:hypothetical protein EON65_39945 [archaeon]|nr:MAG: hypothetical protein EON65_39945 [archaeon]
MATSDEMVKKGKNGELKCKHDLVIATSDERSVISKTLIMTDKEKVLLYRTLLNSTVYFEYGCGGSTKFACEAVPSLEIHSVDSSSKWIEIVENSTCIREGVEKKRVHMSWINIGKTKRLGYPANEAKKHKWPVYSESVKSVGKRADFVLVDGRFRVASCLKSLLYTDPVKAKIAVHDFFRRKDYYDVLKYADIIDCQDNLVILRAKADLNRGALERDIMKHLHNPA